MIIKDTQYFQSTAAIKNAKPTDSVLRSVIQYINQTHLEQKVVTRICESKIYFHWLFNDFSLLSLIEIKPIDISRNIEKENLLHTKIICVELKLEN